MIRPGRFTLDDLRGMRAEAKAKVDKAVRRKRGQGAAWRNYRLATADLIRSELAERVERKPARTPPVDPRQQSLF